MEPEKLLTSPDLDLTSDNLKNGLGRWFSIYDTLTTTLSNPPYEISPEWRFYRDGGAWLCRMTRKKQTVFWISAWKQFLKCGFYFTKKSGDGISALSIDESLKSSFDKTDPIGKLRPLIIDLTAKKQLGDLYTVASYMISRK
ncbi:MAG: DUF3788 family protein [Verrucomicrobiales bacterium]|nr:DUF3788 family protein [Verrucomicrobiales bacterium]